MNRRLYVFMLAAVMAAALGLGGCMAGDGKKEENEKPVVVVLWHSYNAVAKGAFDDLVMEFNETVGMEQGIIVEPVGYGSSNELDDVLYASASHVIGSDPLPDIFSSYPDSAYRLDGIVPLVHLDDYFTEEELDAYRSEFLKEGVWEGDGIHRMIPVAKSTEIMYINQTIFDRFSQATGVAMEDLDTWEGLFKAAEVYADWTDAQTPDISGDAKSMFVHDYYFNYFQVGAESLGEKFFQGDKLAFGPAFQTAWEPLAQAALHGGVWLKGGYATESIRTGDSIVSVASSASILYYSDVVTYPDNTSEEITIVSRPCPVFENGEKLVMQRGAGFCTVRSTPEREQAAVTFLKWLTEPEHNVEFVTRTGYMPVTRAAFENELPKAIEGLESAKYASLYQAYLDTQANYGFYVPP